MQALRAVQPQLALEKLESLLLVLMMMWTANGIRHHSIQPRYRSHSH
jgi:hypothetical protein